MKKILATLLVLVMAVGMIPAFPAMAQTNTISSSDVIVTRRDDDESKFGTYDADEDSTPQNIASTTTRRWLFTHKNLNGTYLQMKFNKAYKITAVNICSSTDEGQYPNRSVWHASIVIPKSDSVVSVINEEGLNGDDRNNHISFTPVSTDCVWLNLFGPGTSSGIGENGGVDKEPKSEKYRMGIQYITFEYEEADHPEPTPDPEPEPIVTRPGVLDDSKVTVARRGDDESKFGTYAADINSTPQNIASENTARWVFTHTKNNGTYLQFDFDKAYTITAVNICSSTDGGLYSNRSVWHAHMVVPDGTTVFNRTGLNGNDNPNYINGFKEVTTNSVLMNLWGPGISADSPNGGADGENGKYRMAIRYISFEIRDGNSLILDFDNMDNIIGSVGTNPTVDTQFFTQGTASCRMNFTESVGKEDNIGAKIIYSAPVSLDLSSFKAFSLDAYFPTYFWGRNALQICFATNGEVGYNFIYSTENFSLGWRTLYFGKSDFADVSHADWSKINTITITWINYDQYNLGSYQIMVDNLTGYEKGLNPYTDERDYLVLDDFESTKGIGTRVYSLMDVCDSSENVTRGDGSLRITPMKSTGQSANIGFICFMNFDKAVDLSKYDVFAFDLCITNTNRDSQGTLRINFLSDTSNDNQDGYNISVNLNGKEAGWHRITFNRSDVKLEKQGTDWSKIKAIGVTWFNDQQISSDKFYFDDFVAYKAGKEKITQPEHTLPVNFMLGDTNDDKIIDVKDALKTLRQSIGIQTGMTDRQISNADIDRHNGVDASDSLQILKRSIDMIDSFYNEDAYYRDVNSLLKDKPDIRCDKNGNFTVMAVSDMHVAYHSDGQLPVEYEWQLRKLCENAKPGLIVLNGDTISNGADLYPGNYHLSYSYVTGLFSQIDKIVSSYGCYWILTFGNHDSIQGNLTKKDQLKIAEQFGHFAGRRGNVLHDPYDRYGNYVVPVLNNSGTEVVFNCWCIDTGIPEDPATYCADVTDGEIKWYKTYSDIFKKLQNGKPVYGSMYGHIRLNEISMIINDPTKYNMEGEKHEGGAKQGISDSKLGTAFQQQGDIKGFYCGHDHNNNFKGVVKGIEYGFDGSITVEGYGGYYGTGTHQPNCAGGRYFTIKQSDPSNFKSAFLAYVTLI